MKKQLLENFEEKFYFKTSHYFWHLLTGIAGLALVIGILILLWGVTPSFKPSVDKPKFPEPVKISSAEIKQILTPPSKKPKPKEIAQIPVAGTVKTPLEKTMVEAESTAVDATEQAYLAAVDSLKSLLPPNKYPWKTRGHYQQSWYRKKWIVDYYGISDRLKNTYRKLNIDDFSTKRELLESYLSLVIHFNEKNRYQVFRAAIDVCKDDLSTSLEYINLLKNSVPHFSTEKNEFIRDLAEFVKKNPRDGQAFLQYINQIMPQFAADSRQPALDEMIKFYYGRFKVIDKQKEATDLFLPMLKEFEPAKQVKALTQYYQLYLEHNYAREEEITKIQNRYESEISEANSVLAGKKARKSEYRLLGGQVIGGSIVFIAFIALFLVLLSIQRNIKVLREKMIAAE